MKNAIILIGILLIPFAGCGLWKLQKKINYSFGYQDQVEETVKTMVKPECLKKE